MNRRIVYPETAYYLLRELTDTDRFFYASDGSILRGLDDLKNFLGRCKYETFASHVDGEKNDIGNWVADVINERRLAALIIDCKEKDLMLEHVKLRIATLKELTNPQALPNYRSGAYKKALRERFLESGSDSSSGGFRL